MQSQPRCEPRGLLLRAHSIAAMIIVYVQLSLSQGDNFGNLFSPGNDLLHPGFLIYLQRGFKHLHFSNM